MIVKFISYDNGFEKTRVYECSRATWSQELNDEKATHLWIFNSTGDVIHHERILPGISVYLMENGKTVDSIFVPIREVSKEECSDNGIKINRTDDALFMNVKAIATKQEQSNKLRMK